MTNAVAPDSQQQQIVTTICPSGCGNGICRRVFEDSLGLGCKVYRVCDRPGCHKESSERGGLNLLTSKSERKMKIRKNQKGGGAVPNQSPKPQFDNRPQQTEPLRDSTELPLDG